MVFVWKADSDCFALAVPVMHIVGDMNALLEIELLAITEADNAGEEEDEAVTLAVVERDFTGVCESLMLGEVVAESVASALVVGERLDTAVSLEVGVEEEVDLGDTVDIVDEEAESDTLTVGDILAV